jgi:cyanophycin synthetase
LAAVGQIGAHWIGRRLTGVIGLPGDRADRVIEEAARVAAQAFDRVIVREDADRRGRTQGEVPRLLCEAITRYSPRRECQTITDEASALHLAIDTMQPHEVVVMFYEDFENVRQLLSDRGAIPASRVEPLRIGEDGRFAVVRPA